jgi:hypothetical protein
MIAVDAMTVFRDERVPLIVFSGIDLKPVSYKAVQATTIG